MPVAKPAKRVSPRAYQAPCINPLLVGRPARGVVKRPALVSSGLFSVLGPGVSKGVGDHLVKQALVNADTLTAFTPYCLGTKLAVIYLIYSLFVAAQDLSGTDFPVFVQFPLAAGAMYSQHINRTNLTLLQPEFFLNLIIPHSSKKIFLKKAWILASFDPSGMFEVVISGVRKYITIYILS